MPNNSANQQLRGLGPARPQGGKFSSTPSEQTATTPDQYGSVVQRARQVLSVSQSGLLPKASQNTSTNTNVARLHKTIGDLADLVEKTFDPVWKENYRVALVRTLNAVEKANAGGREPVADKKNSKTPDTFNHPDVGAKSGMDVSTFSARQAGYQQRFNPPPPATAPPSLPLDPTANGNQYRHLDIPGLGTTAIPTQTNPTGSYVKPRGTKPMGHSHK